MTAAAVAADMAMARRRAYNAREIPAHRTTADDDYRRGQEFAAGGNFGRDYDQNRERYGSAYGNRDYYGGQCPDAGRYGASERSQQRLTATRMAARRVARQLRQ